MPLEHLAAKAFHMTDATWEKHTNPWSVWTRYICLPLLVVAIEAYHWIGAWNILAIIALLVWVWLNPRVFQKPSSTNNWASKSVLGERVLLARARVPIPPHHLHAIFVLKVVMLLGVLAVLAGLFFSHDAFLWSGVCLVILGKSWFLDRMVWLYHDMSQAHPDYQKWLY